MNNANVAWKQGFESLHGNADAQLVADEITSIGEEVTPEQIVDKARDPETELHKCFDWDDASAAEKYRLQQARQIVCHLVIVEPEVKDKTPVRLMYQTTRTEGYKTTRLILQNKDEYQSLLDRAFQELSAFRKKYSSLQELDELFETIDTLIA